MGKDRKKLDAEFRPDLQKLIADELDRQLDTLTSRSSAMNARAGNLLVAAGVGAGLQATQEPAILGAVSVALLVLSAIIAIFVLRPTTGAGIPIEALETEAWNDTPAEAVRRLNSWKWKHLDEGENELLARRRWVIGGASVLVLALALAAVNLVPTIGVT